MLACCGCAAYDLLVEHRMMIFVPLNGWFVSLFMGEQTMSILQVDNSVGGEIWKGYDLSMKSPLEVQLEQFLFFWN